MAAAIYRLISGSMAAPQARPTAYRPQCHQPPPQHEEPIVLGGAVPVEPLEDDKFGKQIDREEQNQSNKEANKFSYHFELS